MDKTKITDLERLILDLLKAKKEISVGDVAQATNMSKSSEINRNRNLGPHMMEILLALKYALVSF